MQPGSAACNPPLRESPQEKERERECRRHNERGRKTDNEREKTGQRERERGGGRRYTLFPVGPDSTRKQTTVRQRAGGQTEGELYISMHRYDGLITESFSPPWRPRHPTGRPKRQKVRNYRPVGRCNSMGMFEEKPHSPHSDRNRSGPAACNSEKK